jgi:hypothetical protein
VRQSPASKDVNTETEDIVGIRHQATTGEDTADSEDLVHDVVNCRLCELAIALQLLMVMSCVFKCLINTITNPIPVYSHSIKP